MDTVRRSTNGIAWIKSPTSSVCFSWFHGAVGIRKIVVNGSGYPNLAKVEAVPASSGRHCRATQERTGHGSQRLHFSLGRFSALVQASSSLQ